MVLEKVGRWSCGCVWAATHHYDGSAGLIAATSQCTNGRPVTAASFAPASSVQGLVIGDWDFPFTCTIHFDPPADGLAICGEGGP